MLTSSVISWRLEEIQRNFQGHKKPRFLSLEDTLFEKPQGRSQTPAPPPHAPPPAILGLKNTQAANGGAETFTRGIL